MKKTLFTGCGTALITPFKNGEVDVDALRRLVDTQIKNGIDALIANGTTGEPSTMNDEEWVLVLKTVVEQANGRVPVICGTGGNNTAAVIAKAKLARELGADAQLCVTPYYNKTTQAGLIAHYQAIARNTDLPVIVYNVPSRTGLNILPETLAVLAEEENIIAVKEASANMIQIMDMMRLCGDKIDFYSGSDELTAPIMALGGKGVISVLSNIAPAQMRQMTHGRIENAVKMNLEFMPLIHALFRQTSPCPVKAAAELMGMCTDEVRLPLIALNESEKAALKAEMEKVGLL